METNDISIGRALIITIGIEVLALLLFAGSAGNQSGDIFGNQTQGFLG
jgi:hypothetical protein